MQPMISTIRKLLLLLCFMAVAQVGWAQNPTYQLTVTNETSPSPSEYVFDVYLLRTGATPLEVANMAFGLGFDVSIANGGTLTASIVPGFSDMLPAQVPTTVNIGAPSFVVGALTYR